MKRHKNGTIVVGYKGSYQYLLSALKDALKGKPKVYEIHHITEHIKKEGLRIGLSKKQMNKDYRDIVNPACDDYNKLKTCSTAVNINKGV